MSSLPFSRHLTTAGLLSASAALFIAGFSFLASDGAIETVSVEAHKPLVPVIADTQPPSSSGDEAFRRPLFQRDRQAINEALDATSPPSGVTTSAGDMRVKGILINGARARASLQLADGDAPIWLSVGDEVGEWTVDAITPERVRLRSGDETADLRLYVDR